MPLAISKPQFISRLDIAITATEIAFERQFEPSLTASPTAQLIIEPVSNLRLRKTGIF
jgi:hypothetical protein